MPASTTSTKAGASPYFESKRVLFGLLAANAAVVLTLTLFVFFG
jgi:hypothetical protein